MIVTRVNLTIFYLFVIFILKKILSRGRSRVCHVSN